MLAGLEGVHEGVGLDLDPGVEQVQPLGQVLLHCERVLVRPDPTSTQSTITTLLPHILEVHNIRVGQKRYM